MTQRYRVVGGLTVAGVVNGAEVTQDTLDKAGANVYALLAGGHLEPVKEPAPATSERKGAPKGGDKK